MLMTAFPDLRDAFDADELPVAFILERDSRHSGRLTDRRGRGRPSANDSANRRIKPNRAGHRKQPADD